MFDKIKKSKKALSTGFAWVYGIVMLFGLGVLYIVFNQVFYGYLVPTIKNNVNASTTITAGTKHLIYGRIDQYMTFFNLLPYIIFFVVVIFMIISAIRKEREEEFI